MEAFDTDISHAPPELAALSTILKDHLRLNGRECCRLTGFCRKMGKSILEFSVFPIGSSHGDPRPYIGKVYRADRGRKGFEALSLAWNAGFRPPSLFTVVRPVAYVPARFLLLQEKAPGRAVADIMFEEIRRGRLEVAAEAMEQTARWLAAFHSLAVAGNSRLEQIRTNLSRHQRELTEFLPDHAGRIERLCQECLARLQERELMALVPSHGDFHPMNVFVAGDGRVTGIDLDTFGLQERTADVAYFLAETAIMGYHRLGSFDATAPARRHFLRSYCDAWRPVSSERLGLYLALTFLQSLFYDLCILHTGNKAMVEPWLTNSERCLDGSRSLLSDAQINRRTFRKLIEGEP